MRATYVIYYFTIFSVKFKVITPPLRKIFVKISKKIFFVDFFFLLLYNICIMSVKNQVFLQLYNANGSAVSGEELAKKLCVTRAAVWKAVKALREEGHQIDSSTNRGYTLVTARAQTLPLDAALFEVGVATVHLSSVNSTNAYAQTLQTDKPTLILADCQTSGKARHHGEFSSPAGKGIYMSYLFFPDIGLDKVSEMSANSVKVVADALEGEAREQSVFKDGEKIGGVLVEVTADQDGIERAVIGIGIYTDRSEAKKNDLIIRIVKSLLLCGYTT